jgi:Uma2 family endonuclease
MLSPGESPLSTTLISLEQYLRGTGEYEPDADYVDGEVELRPMGEFEHTTWQEAIHQWFINHRMEWNVRAREEYRVQVSPTRFRIPDVVVWDRSLPTERILTHPPIAVFEVLSPEDRMPRMMVKLADYAGMGIPTIRVIEPKTGEISRFEGGLLVPVTNSFEQLPNTPCWLDWDKIKELLDF